MTPEIRILITGAGTVTCQSVIKGLRQQNEIGVYIVVVDPNPLSAGRYIADSFHQVPFASEPDFIPMLLDIVQREKVQLLIPIVDYEFLELSRQKAEFEKAGCRVAISSPGTIELCNCKDKTFLFFRDNRVRTPKTWAPSDLPPLSELQYPLFIKPRTGRASIGVHKICTEEDLQYWSTRVEDPLYQEFIDGDEYTIDVLSDLEGRVVGVVPRKRIEMKVGVSYKGVTVRDPEMISMAGLIAERAGIIGACNIQCFRNENYLSFFEINPRFSGSLPLTIASGMNSPLLLAKLALGLSIDRPINGFEEGLVMLRLWDEIFVSESEDCRGHKLPRLEEECDQG